MSLDNLGTPGSGSMPVMPTSANLAGANRWNRMYRHCDGRAGGHGGARARPQSDPLVLVHARALLTSAPEGRTAYIQADIRDPEAILTAPPVGELLDFSQPVGLLVAGILHLLADAGKPAEIVATLLEALPSGSYLVASHLTMEHDRKRTAAGQAVMRGAGIAMQKHDSDVFAKIAFNGLDSFRLAWCWCRNGGRRATSPARRLPR